MQYPEPARIKGIEGGQGIFAVKDRGAVLLWCVATTEAGWDHVSVSVNLQKKKKVVSAMRCPTWDEMCLVKKVFFTDEEPAFELHPPKSEWVSTHPFCLHLWSPNDGREFPRPPGHLIGIPGSNYQKLDKNGLPTK